MWLDSVRQSQKLMLLFGVVLLAIMFWEKYFDAVDDVRERLFHLGALLGQGVCDVSANMDTPDKVRLLSFEAVSDPLEGLTESVLASVVKRRYGVEQTFTVDMQRVLDPHICDQLVHTRLDVKSAIIPFRTCQYLRYVRGVGYAPLLLVVPVYAVKEKDLTPKLEESET